jgi:hypothetical protein
MSTRLALAEGIMWDLLHAWREWLAGHDITHLRVFGIEVRWWGRLGKMLEFLGGLTVVIDLLGRERMEGFHTTLRRRRARLLARLRGNPTADGEIPVKTVDRKTAHETGLRVAFIVGTVAMGLFIAVAEHYAHQGDPMPIPVLLLVIATAAPSLGGFVLGWAGYLLGLLLLEAFVVTTLGQLKTREGLESRLKLIGLAIFIAGFSMDLLSS